MQLKHFNQHLNIDTQAFAWRYINYPKLYDLLFNNEIYFTRLDCFDDPLEGLNAYHRLTFHFKNVAQYDEIEDSPLKKIFSQSNESLKINKHQISLWQQGIFSSCWYLTEGQNNHEESLAMWNLYGDKNSFVVKIPFSSLHKIISHSVDVFTDSECTEAGYGKVDYLNYHEQTILNPSENNKVYPSLIKQKSFKHENEIRFLLIREKSSMVGNLDRLGIRLKLKSQFINEEVEILTHPDMHIHMYDLYNEKIKPLGVKIKHSSLLTREVFNSLIK